MRIGVRSKPLQGAVRLEDGRAVHGFLCERAGLAGAREITRLGGWRAYLRLRGRG
jgi:allophanate hydrolase